MSNNQSVSRNGRTSKRGLFVKGIWHCDCELRLPAEKFQVKNGGQNHGRWFYTCQQPQPKRCSFFLWSDDAKVREEAAVRSNGRTEPSVADEARIGTGGRLRSEQEVPKTPKRQTKITEPFTPASKHKSPSKQPPSSSFELDENDEIYDWSSSADEELLGYAERLETRRPAELSAEEPPRKSVKISALDSPSKRTVSGTLNGSAAAAEALDTSNTVAWLVDDGHVFQTPSTSNKSRLTGLLSPTETPAQVRRQRFLASDDPKHIASPQKLPSAPASLTSEALSILAPVRARMSSETEKALVALLNRHEIRTLGIEKGREIARTALEGKDKKILELQEKLAVLEAERETSRAVIQHLKHNPATSPKKPRLPAGKSAKNDDD